jgi:hypothetical protein
VFFPQDFDKNRANATTTGSYSVFSTLWKKKKNILTSTENICQFPAYTTQISKTTALGFSSTKTCFSPFSQLFGGPRNEPLFFCKQTKMKKKVKMVICPRQNNKKRIFLLASQHPKRTAQGTSNLDRTCAPLSQKVCQALV